MNAPLLKIITVPPNNHAQMWQVRLCAVVVPVYTAFVSTFQKHNFSSIKSRPPNKYVLSYDITTGDCVNINECRESVAPCLHYGTCVDKDPEPDDNNLKYKSCNMFLKRTW